jgi:hypothetical protein
VSSSTSPGRLNISRDFFQGVSFTLDRSVAWSELSRSSTSAAVTIIQPTRAAKFQATEDWLTRRFEEAREALDRVLSCAGFLAGLPNVGALRHSDFPSSVPLVTF